MALKEKDNGGEYVYEQGASGREFCKQNCAGWHEYKNKAGQPTGSGWCGFHFFKDPCPYNDK